MVPGISEHQFSPRACSAPDRQFAANLIRTLAHPAQAEVPGRAFIGSELWIDAFAVISNANLEALLTVAELHLDTARLGMTKGVSDSFARDPVDLIADERPLLSRRPFDSQVYFSTQVGLGRPRAPPRVS